MVPLSQCRSNSLPAYKNDPAFVEKNGAIVRRLVGYGRFEGIDAARSLARLFATARLHINFFQPSSKLQKKHREGAKVIKRFLTAATPYERALVHPSLDGAVNAGRARSTAHLIRWHYWHRWARPKMNGASA